MESVEEIIDTVDPVMICLTETHLGEDEEVLIPGYSVFHNNRNKAGGGILIGIKEEISGVTVEVSNVKEGYEALWIKIDNGKIRIRAGVVYAPQENQCKTDQVTKMYKQIESEIRKSGNEEKLVLMGDFNCKVGKIIRDNKEEVSRAGRELMRMVRNNKLELINCHAKCQGTWTRIQNDQKSVIDYGIIKDNDAHRIDKVYIDEEKYLTPYRITNGLVYTDHCAMIVELNWRRIEENYKAKYVIDKDKLRDCSGKHKLEKIIMEDGKIKEKYSRWQKEVNEIINKCKRKIRNKRTKNKTVRLLMKARRYIKKRKGKSQSHEERRLAKVQEKLIEEFIRKEKMKEEGMKIKATVDDIKSQGGVNKPAFWDFKKKMDGRKQSTATAIKGKNGEIVESMDEIRKEYKEFYEELFILETPEDELEKTAEKINKMYMEWLKTSTRVASEKLKSMEIHEIEKIINGIKNKYTPDRQDLSNVMIKSMGKEMIRSIALIIKQIENESDTPDEWELMKILSLHKKGSKLELNNRRGIFITSCVSKIFEKVRMEIIKEEINEKISRFQVGGMEGRSTFDHILTLNAVIDYNRYLGAPTYILFGDAYKCFDKLDLNDCVKELGKMVGWKEALMALKLNENGKAVVECPAGTTDNVEIRENVRQGTIYGPKLCGIVTDKINSIGRKNITMIREIEIETLIYVDDVMFPTSRRSGIENAIGNCKSMEKLKKFTFSNNVNKTAVLKVGKKERHDKEPFKTQVKKGPIEMVSEYKYLGEWYHESGNKELNLKKRNMKVDYFISEIKRYGDVNQVGELALEVRMMIYETVVVLTLFANIETWSQINEKEWKVLEGIQFKVLNGMSELPVSTPYWGILAETGIWPVRSRIEYKKLMLFQNIIQSDDKRLIKEIIEDQLKAPYGECWAKSIIEISNKYEIGIEEIRSWSKAALKKEIKQKIKEAMVEEVENKKKDMKKLRFIKEVNKQRYITDMKMKDAIIIMKTRLNMLDLKANYRGKYKDSMCTMCRSEEETTEHILNCKKVWKIAGQEMSVECVNEPNKKLSDYIGLAMLMRDWLQRDHPGNGPSDKAVPE